MSTDLEDFKSTYFEECAELITELEEQFAIIEAGDRTPDRLHAVFRAVHSIKGGGGAFGFGALVAFAHAYETLLDKMRDGRVELTDSAVALCVRANDIISDLVTAARRSEPLAADYGSTEIAQFELMTHGAREKPPAEEFIPNRPDLVDEDDEIIDFDRFLDQPLSDEPGHWEIHFTPHAELYARANDPLLLFRELAVQGTMTVIPILGEIPPLGDFEPFAVYCGWEITLTSTTATETSIREVFEFVEGNCDLVIEQLIATAVIPSPRPEAPRIESIDALHPVVPPPSPRAAPPPTAVHEPIAPRPVTPPVAILAQPDPPPPEEPDAFADGGPAPVQTTGTLESDRRVGEPDRRNAISSIRVDLEKVDRVVDMVGELVIIQSMLNQQMDEESRARYQELMRGLEVLAQTTRGLQDAVMAIRAQPVKSVFSRMPRLVRELAQITGKKLKLEMAGEGTEIDKTVIEQLSDPLTHMIRNSADHGIETPETRLAAGKPEIGTITLSAEQAGGSILIEVQDDGAGINRDRVLQVARQRGIVGWEQQLTDEQVDSLIFAPGFSTAENVSDISGRGVGMDVVLSNIKKIGGSVQVKSAPGRGTRMTLRLPLTLAVLDVMLIKVGAAPYVIPITSIIETIQCARADFSRAPSGAQVLRFRGDYVQVIDLAHRFAIPTDAALSERFVVLCEAEGAVKVALIVDDIIGQQQVVIKSLEENFERIEGIAGGTILGDGNVALILDVQGLRTQHPEERRAA